MAMIEDDFCAYRPQLLSLIRRRLNPVLLGRMDYEDVLGEVYANILKREAYFAANPEVPVYFKFRTVVLQTITDIERRHLGAQARDVYREVPMENAAGANGGYDESVREIEFPAEITSPASRVDRDERHALLRAAVAKLQEIDRQIITLRNLDELGNNDCSAILGIDPKAASIRYVRALEKLQKKLMELSCFRGRS